MLEYLNFSEDKGVKSKLSILCRHILLNLGGCIYQEGEQG